MPELIIRARQGGKTTEMLRLSAEHFAYIVCTDKKTATRLFHRAKEMGLDIPFPLTAHEFFGREFHPRGIKGFLFDDLDRMLADQAGPVPVLAASWTQDSAKPPASA